MHSHVHLKTALPLPVLSEQRPEGSEEVSHGVIGGNSKCKGPEVGVYLVCLRSDVSRAV